MKDFKLVHGLNGESYMVPADLPIPPPEFRRVYCPTCDARECQVNMDFCYVCPELPSVCGRCMDIHRKTHTEAEYQAALAEIA